MRSKRGHDRSFKKSQLRNVFSFCLLMRPLTNGEGLCTRRDRNHSQECKIVVSNSVEKHRSKKRTKPLGVQAVKRLPLKKLELGSSSKFNEERAENTITFGSIIVNLNRTQVDSIGYLHGQESDALSRENFANRGD